VKEVVKEVTRTVTSTTTLAPGAPVTTTVTVTAPPTTVAKTVTTTITATTPTRKAIRIGTTQPGMAGYVMSGILMSAMKEVFPHYDVTLYPIGGPTANTKEFLAGTLEMPWSSATDLKLLYARQEWYKDVKEEAIKPVHTLYILRSTQVFVTTPELKAKYNLNSWKDLNGKKVTVYSAKLETYRWHMKAFELLGIKVTHVELDFEMIPDALLKGDIVACIYSDPAAEPAPWAQSLLVKTKVVLIPPSPEEIKKMSEAGFPFEYVPAERYTKFGIDVGGLDKVYTQPLVLGHSTTPQVLTESDVYTLLKELIKRKGELANMSAYYKEFAEDPIDMQVSGVSLAPEVPVHPGLAKILKEYGVWKDSWKIAR
jgi:TRAP-type uncharacterized transport system substrate-binding protein